jgi:hypothetical protein
MDTRMDPARADLAYIRDVMERTDRRIDPHAFHFVHWGAIVLVWFPLGTWFELEGRLDLLAWLCAGSLALGIALGVVREIALAKRPRLEGENTFVSDQVKVAAFAHVAAGVLLTILAPTFGFLSAHDTPTIWGLAYAGLAFSVGLVYRREFLWSAAAIFGAVLLAIAWPQWNGFFLGPAMGLGLLIPGLRAERRVRQLALEAPGA